VGRIFNAVPVFSTKVCLSKYKVYKTRIGKREFGSSKKLRTRPQNGTRFQHWELSMLQSLSRLWPLLERVM